jgi:hypothetical protein
MGPVGGEVTFHLFEVRGAGILVSFLDLFTRNGPIWLTIEIFSVFVLIFGIIGLFSLVYTSFSDTRNLQTGWIVKKVFPGLTVFFMAFQWILFGIAFAIATPSPEISIDSTGLAMSVFSMILILLAINRDYIFREKEISSSNESKGGL